MKCLYTKEKKKNSDHNRHKAKKGFAQIHESLPQKKLLITIEINKTLAAQ